MKEISPMLIHLSLSDEKGWWLVVVRLQDQTDQKSFLLSETKNQAAAPI
jgi:hypothetical protein